MKYRKDGRTYRLVLWFPFIKIMCGGCAFHGIIGDKCPKRENVESTGVACTKGDGINRIWRETIPSKIANWIRGKK